MGLTTWKNAPHGPIRRTDVEIAKNYLSEGEITELNRIVSMYLDYAEDQARKKIDDATKDQENAEDKLKKPDNPGASEDQDKALQKLNEAKKKLEELLRQLGRPTHWHGRRVRALHPLAPDDSALLAAVSRGEFTLNGFRNRDLRAIFFPYPAKTLPEARRRSAWVSRQLRLLRAHSVIRKVAGTHRYLVTPAGRTVITAVLTALGTTVRQLTPVAA